MNSLKCFATALCLLVGTIAAATPTVASLPSYKGDYTQTSVSGLSSGAFMAVQYQVAYSASVVGAGIVAGGPYYCAAGNIFNASICMGQVPFVPPLASLMVASAQSFAAAGQIDPLPNLQNAHVYVFSGTKDTVVRQQAVNSTVDFFHEIGVPSANLKYVNNVPSGHALITPSFGNTCPTNATPYVSHCTVDKVGYDQPGALLTQIYGSLNPPAKSLSGKIVTFDHNEFAPALTTGMADKAYVYVPKSCAQGASCKVHVAFHGCMQSAETAGVGDDFYGKTSYNNWADTNNIMVLYPQVNATLPLNSGGCWDWYGYTGPNYAWKSGAQLSAVNAMIHRLLGQ